MLGEAMHGEQQPPGSPPGPEGWQNRSDPRWRGPDGRLGDGGGPQPPTGGPSTAPAYPRRPSGLERLVGGDPLGVLVRLVLLSIIVGVIFAVLGFNPRNLVQALSELLRSIIENSAELVDSLLRYFLLGAAIVFPIWLVMRLIKIASRR
jgi:hypothetical protein